jgi:hypothetical protein
MREILRKKSRKAESNRMEGMSRKRRTMRDRRPQLLLSVRRKQSLLRKGTIQEGDAQRRKERRNQDAL